MVVECWECTNFRECNYSGQLTGRLTSCPDFQQKPMTNADRIRAMTDEELEKFIKRVANEGWLKVGLSDVSKWLQQPAEE